MLNLAVDIDGVLADTPAKLAEILTRELGNVRVRPEEIKVFDLATIYGSQVHHIIEKYEEEIYKEVLPVKDAAIVLTEAERFCHITYLTNRPVHHCQLTLDWLKKHGFPTQHSDYVFVGDKVSHAKRLGVRAAIEDSPRHIEHFELAGIITIIYDRPYNRTVGGTDRFRAKDWNQVQKLLEEISTWT